MVKYKAKDSYKDAENKHFDIGTARVLMGGGTIELDDNSFNCLPKDIKEHFELLNKPKPKKVLKDTKKTKKEINNGTSN